MKKSFAIFIFILLSLHIHAQKNAKAVLTILYSPGHAVNKFIPIQTSGAAFDGHSQGDINRILTRENIHAMRSVGLGPLSYRLRTELGIEAWHWNPQGRWSDEKNKQGYWISDNHSSGDIMISNGYRLPRRGNTHDQANDDDYSRLDDGDTTTFWKSNPYLDEYFTKEPNQLHPQWIIADLGKTELINAVKIHWGNPFAVTYKIDYAENIVGYFDPYQPGIWHHFSDGNIKNSNGETRIDVVSSEPQKVRFIRITMVESSATIATSSADIRDRLGFAIKEIEIGWLDKQNSFHDVIHHSKNNAVQSITYASSTDPWHRAVDLDVNTEQAGIDRFFKSGLANGQPVLWPVSLLYDTPENMVTLLQYIKAKNYNVQELEMGEEPEGQLVHPHDYAALYCQWADEIKKIDGSLKFGGPGFASLATTHEDKFSFTEQTWTRYFLEYLKAHSHLDDFNFFSFEWYPFDDVCEPTAPQLAANPQMMKAALTILKDSILPAHTPLYMTEYGYSAHSGQAQVDIEGALMYADILGKFLELGGTKAYLYGYEPTYLDNYNNCSWGNNMLFGMDENGKIIYHTAAYYGMKMLTQHCMFPNDSTFEMYSVKTKAKNRQKENTIAAYALYSAKGRWSIAIINKNPKKSYHVLISVKNLLKPTPTVFKYPVHLIQYSHLQYQWFGDKAEGHPSRELPPAETKIRDPRSLNIPPYSLTVIKEED